VAFDDSSLVANAGLVWVATLAARLGVQMLVDAVVRLHGPDRAWPGSGHGRWRTYLRTGLSLSRMRRLRRPLFSTLMICTAADWAVFAPSERKAGVPC
jgi:hypothetical protein